MLKNDKLPADAREQLVVVERNTNRMLRLVNQILDFRKIQNKKMKMQVQQLNVVAFVRKIMDNFESVAEEHHIDFLFQTEKEALNLWVDADKFEKIVFNLLSNAFKYTPNGKMITVFIREDEGTVSVGVQDQGIGIAENKRKSLFVRFENLVDKNKFNQASSGIGLSLVKDLVELHGGSIEVESEEGRGTEFIVTLPVDRSYFKEEQIDEEAVLPVQKTVTYLEEENAENVVAEQPKAHTILVVEDNEELLQLMVRLLKREYNVHTAENGQEAVTVLDNEDIDLIVSDVMLPVMDGIEFCRYVKNKLELSHIPVILLTA